MSNPKYDIYSDMRVPFSVSAFCRDRRMNKNSVALASALHKLKEAKAAEEAARAAVSLAEKRIEIVVKDVERFMEEQGAS